MMAEKLGLRLVDESEYQMAAYLVKTKGSLKAENWVIQMAGTTVY